MKRLKVKLEGEELQAYLQFKRRGKRHSDRRKPRGKERSLARQRAWEEA